MWQSLTSLFKCLSQENDRL